MMDNTISDSVKIGTHEVEKQENECKPIEHTKERKNMKEDKVKKKDEKSVEQVLKALNSLATTEEKLAAICKRYSEIADDNRKLQTMLKQTEKKLAVTQREKEQFQSEHSKAILTRSRLESLCRELQKQNKAVKDESLLKIREEEEKRKEVSAKFQTTLSEITALMNQNNEKNTKLHEDNLEMTKKLKAMCEQYEIRSQQVEKLQQQMELSAQLAENKLAEARLQMAAEKEVLLREKQQLLLKSAECYIKVRQHQVVEAGLREQISMYTERFQEFQKTLSKNTEVFGGFKDGMEKMTNKILKLEKELSLWKQRCENTHGALLEMAADKQQRDAELATTSRKLARLKQLCRALQGERSSLLAQLKAKVVGATVENAEVIEDIALEENIKSIEDINDLSQDCQQLKENLVQLQDSLADAIKKETEEKLQEAETLLNEKTEHVNKDRSEVPIAKRNFEYADNEEKKGEDVERFDDVDVKALSIVENADSLTTETEDAKPSIKKESLSKIESKHRMNIPARDTLSHLMIENEKKSENLISPVENKG
ncbi:alpha-taxilin isoform X2 [Athalia rosae]|nr:alpha-taxilin isoform X2 [Athalia rosae]XP_048512347.1 alpha-taxilin isoform X2 [Athalia rosae]